MNRQAKKLQKKSKRHEVEQLDDNRFSVTSATSGETYTVFRYRGSFRCQCKFGVNHPNRDCSHTLAIRDHLALGSLSYWSDETAAARQHRHTEELTPGLLSTERRPSSDVQLLQAIATLNYSAIEAWLLAHGEQPSVLRDVNYRHANNLLYAAGAASAEPFTNNLHKAALRYIRYAPLTGKAAAEYAANVLGVRS